MTEELKRVLEALLFSAERPMGAKQLGMVLMEVADTELPAGGPSFRTVRESQIEAALQGLKIEYDTLQRSFQLVEIAGGWRLVSRSEYAPWLREMLDEPRAYRLSQPSLETLAIIALRQPICRADIAAIRGVEVDGVVKTLLEHNLITIAGRSNEPGRAMMYGTTQQFLEQFGLRSLDDVPKAAELRVQAMALKTKDKNIAQSETVQSENHDEAETGKRRTSANSGQD